MVQKKLVLEYTKILIRFQSNHKISNKLFWCKNRIDEYSKIGFKNVSDIFEKKTNNPDFYARQ